MDAKSPIGGENLPGIEKVLADALAKVQSQEESLAPIKPLNAPSLAQPLEAVRQRLKGLQAMAEGPRLKFAEADEQFQKGEEELRQFLAAAESVRQRLAEWVGRAIG